MIINPDYDLARPLQSALKAKAPYVGVPIPGHAPLIFQRDKLVRALNGVKPIHMYVEVYENGNRALIVDGVAGPRCRTHMKAASLRRDHLVYWGDPMKAAERWRKGYKPKPAAATRDPLAKYRKELARLDKALAKLGERPEIANPCTSTGPYYEGEYAEDWRKEWREWFAQKPTRAQIGRLAALTRAGKLDAREMYQELRKIPDVLVTTFSAVDSYTKRRQNIDTFHKYVEPRKLWTFMRTGLERAALQSRPYRGRWQEDDPGSYPDLDHPKWGAKRYTVVLEWIQERRELEDRIAAVKVMMEDATAKHTGRC